ncbi:hypothetical protein Thermo_00130 [Thermoplasmatales archaeon]|nr:hypothetical protein Thermo_00130 [Thermoplasmatales archaeon]
MEKKNMVETVIVFIGKKKIESGKETTVGALLALAGFSPSEYILELREGEGGPVINKYTEPTEKLELKEGEHFTTKYIGPIQPSD